MLVTTRKARRGAAWLNPVWDPEVEVHEVCTTCRARLQIHQADARR